MTLDVVYPGQPDMFEVMSDGLLCLSAGDGRKVRIALLNDNDLKYIGKYVEEV